MRKIWVFAVLLSISSVCLGQNWPQWRGPFLNGSAEIKDLPASWSETENKAWELKLPGDGAATPIVWGDKLFLASTDSSYVKLLALCIDINSGKVIWQKSTFIAQSKGCCQREGKAC